MRNARKFDRWVTIGTVPSAGDLRQLKELGYKLLVDLRELDEIFSGRVHDLAEELGFDYVAIPVPREDISYQTVEAFYRTVYGAEDRGVYAFSRLGKKPLAFLLLFEVVAEQKPLTSVYRRASRLGINLEGDLALRTFLVEFYNRGDFGPMTRLVHELRADLLPPEEVEKGPPKGQK